MVAFSLVHLSRSLRIPSQYPKFIGFHSRKRGTRGFSGTAMLMGGLGLTNVVLACLKHNEQGQYMTLYQFEALISSHVSYLDGVTFCVVLS